MPEEFRLESPRTSELGGGMLPGRLAFRHWDDDNSTAHGRRPFIFGMHVAPSEAYVLSKNQPNRPKPGRMRRGGKKTPPPKGRSSGRVGEGSDKSSDNFVTSGNNAMKFGMHVALCRAHVLSKIQPNRPRTGRMRRGGVRLPLPKVEVLVKSAKTPT